MTPSRSSSVPAWTASSPPIPPWGGKGCGRSMPGETGGLSGEPLRLRSEAVLRSVVKKLDGRLPVVSVGGIMRPEHARARLDAGAALVQVYTGLVYAGPGLVRQIVRTLR